MSSGNPFRASLSHSPASSSPVPQTSFINADSSVPEAREDGRSALEVVVAPPPKTKKHVRIVSDTTFIPPHPHPAAQYGDDSPNEAFSPRYGHSQDTTFPPSIYAANTTHSNVNAGDPIPPSTWSKSDMSATDMFSSTQRSSMAPQSAVSPGGIPANPFSRTLASIEPQEKGTADDRITTDKAALANSRASLDVESFKNLLMTGKAGPRQPAPQSQAPPSASGTQFESSSSTDTSSISRSSLFEPPQETHAESPRTSYEMPESDEDERPRIVAEVRKEKRKPPPTPKHRHGKLVTKRQPQIVPFESFAAEPAESPVTRPRDNSDVSKPLPPTPVISPPPQVTPQDPLSDRPAPVERRSNESLPVIDTPQSQKRTPPPVPLARRQSQLRSSSSGNRSRSNSSLTMSSQVSLDAPLPSPASSVKDPLAAAKPPPPPPRSRHGARLADVSSSSANSSTTELPQRSSSVRTATSHHEPEPARRVSDSTHSPTADIHRPSSRIVSNDSTTSTSNTAAPPPPPPRRKQSTRSSLDTQRPVIPPASPTGSRRTSTEYRRTSLDSKRRTSVASESSLRHEYAPSLVVSGEHANEQPLYSPLEERADKLGGSTGIDARAKDEGRSDSSNILDDMEKFQREIDELRQKFKQAG